MTLDNQLQLVFYGDDFTGSTDALDFLNRAGIRTVLFLNKPTLEEYERFGHPKAIGIAGFTRTMDPDQMSKTLNQAFTSIKQLNPKHVHYKICSTFDSSPELGNIGTAIETGAQIFKNNFTPVLVAAPHLGRYSAFGNLYARMGIGSQGAIYRLDRHPSMSRHPVTPALESDLRLHLSKQTDLPMGLIDLIDIAKSPDEIITKLNQEIEEGKKIIFIDAMYENQMAIIGEVFDQKAEKISPLFSVGSSGIEKALGDFWMSENRCYPPIDWESLSECKPMLVLSGSVSLVTASQIEWAVKNGFSEISVDADLITDNLIETYISEYQEKIVSSLINGKSVILHTAKGPEDPRVQKSRSVLNEKSMDGQKMKMQTVRLFGKVLGQSARRALENYPLKRLVIAGGDTSSYVVRELGIQAVEMIAPLYPGSPVCRAYAPGSPVDGIEVNIKGGQVGDKPYFGSLQKGKFI